MHHLQKYSHSGIADTRSLHPRHLSNKIDIALTPADPHTLKVNFVVTSSSSLKKQKKQKQKQKQKQKLLLQMPMTLGLSISFNVSLLCRKILASCSYQPEFDVVPMILPL